MTVLAHGAPAEMGEVLATFPSDVPGEEYLIADDGGHGSRIWNHDILTGVVRTLEPSPEHLCERRIAA